MAEKVKRERTISILLKPAASRDALVTNLGGEMLIIGRASLS
ncbi:MAG: hypothetical protein PHD13_00700 [Methanocellales archaeon]|nr:hypothetical protein [Methanocellales archaeon]MDD3291425.1 hypothetical protein [Methanocellales archaeon]MDD5234685.1 hypothetical protein [Methanocellales archaeon]